jgi:hypothetical protein
MQNNRARHHARHDRRRPQPDHAVAPAAHDARLDDPHPCASGNSQGSRNRRFSVVIFGARHKQNLGIPAVGTAQLQGVSAASHAVRV